MCVLAVHGGAAQQLHALTDALVTACAAADLTAHCDEHIQGRSGSSSGSRKLQLWPTCSASNGSSIACGTEPAEPQQQQQQQQQLGQKGAEGTNSLPLHLSLSQTVPIRYGQAASLKAALEQQLRPCRKFKLQLAGLVCLTNEPKTRSFVCIRVASGSQQVGFALFMLPFHDRHLDSAALLVVVTAVSLTSADYLLTTADSVTQFVRLVAAGTR
jgi:hypothetical protein